MHHLGRLPAELDDALLEALVQGFAARAGAKERFQALSEYELARRMGIVGYTYVEYDSSPEREAIRLALGRLQGRGLVHVAAVAGRYETFLPTSEAIGKGGEIEEEGLELPSAPVGSSCGHASSSTLTLEVRLDEIVRLLRSIDERLGRLERS